MATTAPPARGGTSDPAAPTAVSPLLAEEMAIYRARLAELLQHEGAFVLIKGTEVVEFFPERRLAQRAGYERFGIVPFLVKRVEQVEPVAYMPNVVP